jgi:hypothetical protein
MTGDGVEFEHVRTHAMGHTTRRVVLPDVASAARFFADWVAADPRATHELRTPGAPGSMLTYNPHEG